jgi:hypothetical protein
VSSSRTAYICARRHPTPQDKLNYFWIVEKKSLEDRRAELRNKERELQDLDEKHQVEIKVGTTARGGGGGGRGGGGSSSNSSSSSRVRMWRRLSTRVRRRAAANRCTSSA